MLSGVKKSLIILAIVCTCTLCACKDKGGIDTVEDTTVVYSKVLPSEEEKETTKEKEPVKEESVISFNDNHVHSWEIVNQTGGSTCTSDVSILYECSKCGMQKMETLRALGHEYEVVTVEATCSSPGYTEYTCSKCGASYREDVTALLEHTVVTVTEQEATCLIEGIIKKYCEVCGEVLSYENVPALEHDWVLIKEGIACSKNNAENVYECSNCKETVREKLTGSHNFNAWTLMIKSTCAIKGMQKRTCTLCGEIETQELELADHAVGAWAVTENATCVSEGKKVRTCTVCKQVVDEESIDKVAHNYGSWKVDKEATCSSAGKKSRSCSVCGEKETAKISKAEHSYEWVVDIEPVCTENGSKVYKCSECGDISETEAIEALGHDWSYDSDTVICTRCGETKSE